MFGSDASVSPSVTNFLDNGKAQQEAGISLETFLASLSVAAVVFGVELGVFILARKRMQRIYEPRTYLVPEKRRTPISGSGLFDWIKPIFATSTSEFISKSGLDAYFFLRYLLMLLKIFIMLAVVILPILLPLNSIGGKGENHPDDPVKGMDKLAWTNIPREKTDRYWAHLILAVFVVTLCCYMFYRELRVYIRLRQAYLTSPQHRLRASATTVLVTSVPRKWLNIDALLGLYDVFPGGVRNIWINRDFHDLQEKVKLRNQMAKKLERAETDLIRLAKQKHMKKMRKLAKSNPEAQQAPINTDMSEVGGGVSSGDPHQHSRDRKDKEKENDPTSPSRKAKFPIPIPLVGGVMNSGIDRLNSGFKDVGKVVKDILPGNHQTHGFMVDQEEDRPGINRRNSSLQHVPTRGSTIEKHRSFSYGEEDSHRPAPATIQPTGPKKPWDGKLEGKPDDDERPLAVVTPNSPTHPPGETTTNQNVIMSAIAPITKIFKGREDNTVYPQAYNPEFQDDSYGEPVWKKYLSEKDRPTHRLPLASFLPAIPLIGQKVDTIHYCRKEIARLNVEIEHDQTEPEKYPLMNSAFIQFNNQVAAHMACQSLNHHLPQQMGPRYLEVNPNDVVWENMRIKWWERYLRSMLVTIMVGGLIIGWAVPVAFVGLVSQLTYLADTIQFLAFVKDFPDWITGLISGVLPPLGLAILMALLPIILRTFAKVEGLHTGMSIELSVQGMYFAFLFVQVFLVVSISSGFMTVFEKITDNPTSAAGILAENLPKASNFFFSYLLLQAFAQSGGALVQIGSLVVYYLLAPFVDTTARQKWARQVALPEMQWGTFFPIYTNLACIGLVYSVISPLILLFNIFTFGLFWIVYRYNLLFVTNFKFDTGGLLFPRAINQLFTGLYVMEVCLIGLFFLLRDEHGEIICFPQGVIMFIVMVFTILYQRTLNKAFGPLLTYLPITLEDDAVLRDQEFAKEHDERRRLALVEDEEDGENIVDLLERREKREVAEDRMREDIELREIEADNQAKLHGASASAIKRKHQDRWTASNNPLQRIGQSTTMAAKKLNPFNPRTLEMFRMQKEQKDLEDQRIASIRRANRAEFALFDEIPDEIEDLTPEERDRLVERAFQHAALRAKRPVIWIPRDDLGISDDEIYRTRRFSKHVWVSNEYAGLDAKNKVVYRRSPPDFDARDLVEL